MILLKIHPASQFSNPQLQKVDKIRKRKALNRSSEDVNVSGVCAGIAEYLKVNSTWIRMVFVLITVLTGLIPGIIAYLLLARSIPKNLDRHPANTHPDRQKDKFSQDFPVVPHG